MYLIVNLFDNISNNLSLNHILIKLHPSIIWFNDNYIRNEGDSNKQNILTYLSLKGIFLNLIKSVYYQTLTPMINKKTTFC